MYLYAGVHTHTHTKQSCTYVYARLFDVRGLSNFALKRLGCTHAHFYNVCTNTCTYIHINTRSIMEKHSAKTHISFFTPVRFWRDLARFHTWKSLYLFTHTNICVYTVYMPTNIDAFNTNLFNFGEFPTLRRLRQAPLDFQTTCCDIQRVRHDWCCHTCRWVSHLNRSHLPLELLTYFCGIYMKESCHVTHMHEPCV